MGKDEIIQAIVDRRPLYLDSSEDGGIVLPIRLLCWGVYGGGLCLVYRREGDMGEMGVREWLWWRLRPATAEEILTGEEKCSDMHFSY